MEVIPLSFKHKYDIVRLEEHSAPDTPYYFRYTEDSKALDFIFENPSTSNAYGIYEGEKLIAWGAYRTQWNDDNSNEEGIYEICSIVVDKLMRRKGLGRKLLRHVVQEIKNNQNFKSIYLTVYPENLPPLIMYLQNGFIIYDYKKDVYGPGGDRLYLRLTT